jgi:hypothetical protein
MGNQFLHQNEAFFFSAQISCAQYFNVIGPCFASVFRRTSKGGKARFFPPLVQIASWSRIGVGQTNKNNSVYRLKMRSAAAMVASISSSLCAAETKPASKADGAR